VGSDFKDLIAWQKAMDLVTEVYRLTKSFPNDERFGLTAQLRRAAVSVPSNIAEGQARHSGADFRHFLHQARGSLAEVQTQLLIARNLGYISDADRRRLEERTEEAARILNGLTKAIARD
jgi:four helix bundle protein